MKLNGSRVWLTGASSGIGSALANVLAERGCRLALFARNRDRLETVRDSILENSKESVPPEILVQPGDVTDSTRVRDAVCEAESVFGGLDLVIFNAGIGRSLLVEEFKSDRVREIFEVNFMGVMHGLEAVLPGFLERGSGTLVGISSVAGFRGLPQSAPYCSSKSALIIFLESLRLDLSPRGIRVLTVSPGFVKTPLTDRNRFAMPFLVPADRAAEIIVRGIERGHRNICFPFRMSLMMKLVRVMPVWLFDFMMKWTGTMGKRELKN